MAKQLYTLLISVIFLLTANTAVAQDDDGFCDMRSNGLLAELEGTWMFKQNAGYGVGGSVLPFPLPPHPPQQVTLDYDPERGALFMRHDGQRIALIEVSFDYSEAGMFFLTSDEKEILRSQATNCDQNRVPTLIGTNSYALASDVGSMLINVLDSEFTFSRCVSTDRDALIDDVVFVTKEGEDKFWTFLESEKAVEDYAAYDGDDAEFYRDVLAACNNETGLAGDIALSLVLQFGSSELAVGVIQFLVRIPGARGTARAPVTLTRVGG